MNENKRTIYDDAAHSENIRVTHDGENFFVSETAVFTAEDNSGFSGSSSRLTIKDIEGRVLTIALPKSFVEQLTAYGINHLVNKQPVQKSRKELRRFKDRYRKYFDHQAADTHIEAVYYSREMPVCFISSNLHLSDLLDDADLSADTLI